MHPVNHSTVSTSQQVNSSTCWNSQEIVAVDLCNVIHFKGRSLESNFKKQEQQLLCGREVIPGQSCKHHIKVFGNGEKAR